MPVRVELTDDAKDDLVSYARSGNIHQFIAKLLHLEANGSIAGKPLGGQLKGYYKIPVGDRNWRIVFRVDEIQQVAVVCVIGDRDDAECYDLALKRLQSRRDSASNVSLAAALAQLMTARRNRSKAN